MATCADAPNCTIPDDGIFHFAADPDIGGYGVLIAFVASAWLTYFFVVVAYLFIKDGISDDQMNEVDRLITDWTKRFPRWLSQWARSLVGKHVSSEAIQQVVLMLSDQQLITGAAILIIGYMKHCTIPQYHFNIIQLLGWISFTSHQPTLMILREYLIPRPSMRHWRAIWISGLFAMVGAAQVVTYNDDFLDTYGMSTQCIWNNMLGNYSRQWLILLAINSFLLVWGYLVILAILFPDQLKSIGTVNSALKHIFKIPSRIHRSSRSRLIQEKIIMAGLRQNWKTSSPSMPKIYYIISTAISCLTWHIVTGFTFLLFLFFFTISEILYSVTIDLFRIYASLLWATTSLFKLKWSASENGMDGSESEWGFGQLLPLLLLILPVFAAWEIIYDELVVSKSHSTTTSPSSDQQLIILPDRSLSEEPSSSSIDITNARISTRLMRRFLLRRINPDTEARIGSPPEQVQSVVESKRWELSSANNVTSLNALEDAMYRHWLFKLWLYLLISGSFGGVTVGALKGYAL